MVTLIENGHGDSNSNPGRAYFYIELILLGDICIHFPSSYEWMVGQTVSFNEGMAIGLEEEQLWI